MNTPIQKIYRPDLSTNRTCPLFISPVEAGFPTPAEDYIEGRLDLNKHLIKHPAATFFVRAVLMPENEEYNAIELTDGIDCEIWGVIVHVVHSL